MHAQETAVELAGASNDRVNQWTSLQRPECTGLRVQHSRVSSPFVKSLFSRQFIVLQPRGIPYSQIPEQIVLLDLRPSLTIASIIR